MVKEIQINNFKSIQDLKLELGRLNVFIGENGCGKSNVLEAIAMGSAAAKNELSNEFLFARGIRVTDSVFMRSAFKKQSGKEPIQISLIDKDLINFSYTLHNENKPYSEWRDENNRDEIKRLDTKIQRILFHENGEVREIESSKIWPHLEELQKLLSKPYLSKTKCFSNFIVYAPENYFLRRFEEEAQIEPLGIRGEGLFKLLTVLASEKPDHLQEIKNNLNLIDWFGDFEIPNDLDFTERRIKIKDRFLNDGLEFFDQRSANEGFLFLLFYFSLFISDYTPKFFAIDNIDNALNPKLCRKLIGRLAQLSKDHDKQAILTTHNPAVLDGLDLNDDEQRLFVIYRNADGHTKARRILKPQLPEGVEPIRLSEMFLRGSIGGLPKNF